MNTAKIIKNKLNFLFEGYDFKLTSFTNGGTYYELSNSFGKLTYFEWRQFDERSLSVSYDGESKLINLFEHYPSIFSEVINKKTGLFGDDREKYFSLLALAIKKEIENNRYIFGLKIG